MREICARHSVQEVGYDPWNSRVGGNGKLIDDGVPMLENAAGLATMGQAYRRS